MKKLILGFLFVFFTPSLFAENYSSEEAMLKNVRDAIDTKGLDVFFTNFINHSSQDFPLKMNSLDTLTGMYYVKSNKALTTGHMLSTDWKSQIMKTSGRTELEVASFIPKTMQDQAIARACSVNLNFLFFEYDVKLIGVYSDSTGAILFTTVVSKKDCQK